ncbi:hypothetical protein [Microbacterium sp. 1.5R]|uniref:hypothetical protein n=1 Tax=Microbacterium sp. 1.5R TaxID=1916917 RepID=UPI0011A51AF5|nr:hypothetical protein [Microbacterium sp. 1.5R]
MNDTDTTRLVFDLSIELISTARAKEYGQLRDDMTESIIMKKVYGAGMTDSKRAEVLARTLHMVLSSLSLAADETSS